jgi:hypothetical protein
MSTTLEPLTHHTLPARIARALDRALEEAGEVIAENIEAFNDRSGDGPRGADSKGNVSVKVTLTLTLTHALESGLTAVAGSASVSRPKARAKGAPLVYRHGSGLQVEVEEGEAYDPEGKQARLDLDATAETKPPRLVRG